MTYKYIFKKRLKIYPFSEGVGLFTDLFELDIWADSVNMPNELWTTRVLCTQIIHNA